MDSGGGSVRRSQPMASIGGGDAAQRSELVFAIRLPPDELAGRDIEGTRDRILHSVQEADPHAGC